MIKRLLFILLLAGFSHGVSAIGDDSTHHRYNPFWTKFYRLGDSKNLSVVDTTLSNFELYNPVYNYNNFMSTRRHIGNLGYPSYSFTPYWDNTSGPDIGIHAYDPYLFTPETNLFYRTQKPYTVFYYLTGGKSEQLFSGTHTQNITTIYNFGVNFRILNSPGGYKHQKAGYFNLNIFQTFNSKNERYHADVSALMNKATVHVNGGIAIPRDSVFHSSRFITSGIVPVKLDSAIYHYSEYHATVQHSYAWGNYYEHKENDTTKKKMFSASLLLQHRFDFKSVRHVFTDDSSDFDNFPAVIENIYRTADTIKYNQVTNEISLVIPDLKFKDDSVSRYHLVGGNISLRHDLLGFQQGDYGQVENGTMGLYLYSSLGKYDLADKGVLGKYYSRISWTLEGNYSFMDYNKGDYYGSLYATYKLLGVNIGFYGSIKHFQPSLIQQLFEGNYYQWHNTFSTQTYKRFGGVIYTTNRNVYFSYSKKFYTDPVYYGYEVKPEQFKETVESDVFTLALNIRLKHFHFNNQFVVQHYNNDVFHLPKYYSSHSFYYLGFLFNKALQLQTGLNANYNTSYYADAFDPSTSQFYLQNKTKTGDYLMMDAFVNMKIKSVRISIQMDNILQGVFEDGVETAPGYLMPNRAFKVSINWMFWN